MSGVAGAGLTAIGAVGRYGQPPVGCGGLLHGGEVGVGEGVGHLDQSIQAGSSDLVVSMTTSAERDEDRPYSEAAVFAFGESHYMCEL
jgi:hypothetical protein